MPHNEAGELASGSPVASGDLQPGDILVFANTCPRGLSHAGNYLGEGRFARAADESPGVVVSTPWDSYWRPRLVGASRVLG
jgi:cell wall-associated NlpC family hydrolase